MSLGQYVVTAITLTADGWKFIGRTPPASIGRPVAAVPDAPRRTRCE